MGDLIKSLFPEDRTKNGLKVNSKQKKYIAWLVVVAIIGVFAVSFGNVSKETKEPPLAAESKLQTEISQEAKGNLAIAEQQLAQKLENILGQIAGVGEVAVNLTLESSAEYHYATNHKVDKTQVSERAQDGSTRATDETREDTQLVMKNMTQGQDEPVIVKEIRPQVVGVMIVAQGANDLLIKEKISSAVQTLLDIPAHRVTVLPKGK
ncbi:MAG: stage III sporulation protein AH [Peptococcales bacterium]|jgi:stage III sporulation protein AG